MSNIQGLHDDAKNDGDDSDDNNDRYVGGDVDARDGGSGLAVVPNQGDKASSSNNNDASDAIFNLAENAGEASAAAAAGGSGGGGVRRTTTIHNWGITVDDSGPHRRVDGPNNYAELFPIQRQHDHILITAMIQRDNDRYLPTLDEYVKACASILAEAGDSNPMEKARCMQWSVGV